MGLDIYFYKTKKSSDKDRELEGVIKGKKLEDIYFRKVYFLLDFFGYTENDSFLEISKDKVQDLKERCEFILNNKGTVNIDLTDIFAGDTLYFGPSNCGDEDGMDDFQLIDTIFKDFSLDINWNKETIYMYCSW